MALPNIFSRGVATAGQLLGLPEYGISEWLSGSQQQTQPYLYGSAGGAYVDPGWKQSIPSPSSVMGTQTTGGGGGGVSGGGGQLPTTGGSSLDEALRNMGLTSGGGQSGGGGGGEPSVDWNAVFAPAFAAYNQYEQTIRGAYPETISGIEAEGKQQVSGLEAEQAKRLAGFESQEQKARTEAGWASQDIRREQAELQRGIQSLYGGTTGTGQFTSEILGSKALTQLGRQRQALQYVTGEINTSRENLKTEITNQISKVNELTRKQKVEAKQNLDLQLAQIASARGGLEIEKANKRIEQVNNYNQTIQQLNLLDQEFKQKLLTSNSEGNSFLTALQNRAMQEFQATLYALGESPGTLGMLAQPASTYKPPTIKGSTTTKSDADKLRELLEGGGLPEVTQGA